MRDGIKVVIKQLLSKGAKKIAICPYGKYGKAVNKVLKEDFDINDAILIDDFSNESGTIKLADLQHEQDLINDTYVILAVADLNLHDYKKKELSQVFDKEHIIELYPLGMESYLTYLLKESGFDFERCIYTLKRDNTKFYFPQWRSDLIQQNIILNDRYFDTHDLQYIIGTFAHCFEGKNVLDIGANIGNHSLYFAKHTGAKCIYAFEPIPDTYHTLTQNIKINNLSEKIIPINTAIGNANERAAITHYDIYNIGGTILDYNTDGSIPVRSIDSLNLEDIGVIKIDVEGFEYEVISGAIETIKKYKPLIILEAPTERNTFWPIYNMTSDCGYFVQPLDEYDYIFIPSVVKIGEEKSYEME